jgi:hypothetical protein
MGVDAVSTVSEGMLERSDEEQVAWAMSQGRVIVTHDVEDFSRIHSQILERGGHHAGIIAVRQDLSVGEIIRRVAHLCATLSAEDMKDRLEFLRRW